MSHSGPLGQNKQPERSKRWLRVNELFDAAAELQEPERTQFLERECAEDGTLLAEVESLLASDAESSDFIEEPVGTVPLELFSESNSEIAGQQFGAYRIVREIGRGGLGTVYLAERADDEYRKEVALKLVRRGLDTDDILRRFRHERQILAQLDHPNIARLIDGGTTEDGLPYFVMEYVQGATLLEFCDAQNLDTNERLRLFRKVCDAVSYAHQNLVIHRDLKPSNILVTEDSESVRERGGTPKLLDFGIAKLLTPEEAAMTQTIPALRVMTPEYASPEQIKGGAITTSSDVYSLGVLLYELLTGQKPYRLTTRSVEEISRAITDQEPERPSAVRSASFQLAESHNLKSWTSLKGDLDNIILMALRKEPERRYATVERFSEDIRRHLKGLPVSAHKDTVSYRVSKLIRRNRLAASAALVVFLAVFTGLFVSLWQAENARRQRDLAQRAQISAERLNLFLQKMLSFSNQSITSVWPVTQHRNVTVSEMLDQIGPQMDAELAGQPAARAQLLRTIGSAYASQGQYEEAEKSFRAALETQTQLFGLDHSETAATMAELGILCFRLSKLDEADRLLGNAVALYRKQKKAGAPDYSAGRSALALDYLAGVKFYLGDGATAVSLMREAVETSSGADLQGSERRIATFNKSDMGAILVLTDAWEKGEPLLREAAAEYRAMRPAPPWELGSTLRFLGIAALQRNQPEEAGQYLLESELFLRKTLGDKNRYLALTLDRQADAFLRQGNLPRAEEKAREALAMAQAFSPENELPWAPALTTLGDVLSGGQRLEEAEDCYRQALAISEGQATKNHLVLVSSKIRLSQFLLEQKRPAEAEGFALEARDEAKQHLAPDSAATKAATENLIEVHEALGKGALAEQLKVR